HRCPERRFHRRSFGQTYRVIRRPDLRGYRVIRRSEFHMGQAPATTCCMIRFRSFRERKKEPQEAHVFIVLLVVASFYAGRCALRKERIWRTARGIRSFGCFQGKMLTSAFGASIAHSMATAYGWAGTSSGRMRTGFWQLRTKSRVTVKTKSGLVSNIFLTNLSVVSRVISGRLVISVAPQVVKNRPEYVGSSISGRQPTGCANTAAAIRLGARFKRLQMNGPPMQKPITMNLSIPR